MNTAHRINITEVRAARLGKARWEAVATLYTPLNREFDPYTVTISAERLQGYWSTDTPKVTRTCWLAWEGEDPVGVASYGIANIEAARETSKRGSASGPTWPGTHQPRDSWASRRSPGGPKASERRDRSGKETRESSRSIGAEA